MPRATAPSATSEDVEAWPASRGLADRRASGRRPRAIITTITRCFTSISADHDDEVAGPVAVIDHSRYAR
jgi:hypothetical protein